MDGPFLLWFVAAPPTSPKLLAEALQVNGPYQARWPVLNKDDHLATQYYHAYRYLCPISYMGHHQGGVLSTTQNKGKHKPLTGISWVGHGLYTGGKTNF